MTLPDWPVWTRGSKLSGVAAEKEDSSEREMEQSPLNQPSGAEHQLIQPSGAEHPLFHSPGAELSMSPLEITAFFPNQSSDNESLSAQPSDTVTASSQTLSTELSTFQPSGTGPSSIQPEKAAVGKTPALMPLFTRSIPDKEHSATGLAPTLTTQVEETNPVMIARTKEIMRQRSIGTWPGIPKGTKLVIGKDGKARLKDVKEDKHSNKSKDIQETALLNLGTIKAAGNKPSSDDDLGQALDEMFPGTDMNPEQSGNVTPIMSPLTGDENDPDNDVDYSGSEVDVLDGHDDEETAPARLLSRTQSQDAQHDNQPLGINLMQASQPVVTEEAVMELVSKDAGRLTPGSGWEDRKQGYCGLLSGYESPNGGTVKVAIDLAALIIMSAVSQTSIKNSIEMQEAANDKLLQQAEEHRDLAQKQFTEAMRRMQAEQERTISEAARIRDAYASSAKQAQVSFDSMMTRVENNQSANIISRQMACLKARSEKYELELQEISEKHLEELQDKEDLCKRYKRDLEKALQKNKVLEKEKRQLEDSLLSGGLPFINLSAAKQDSVESSPEQRERKRPKVDDRRKPEQRERKKPEQMTTAYTLSAKDAFNLATVTKDPSSIVEEESAFTNQAKATYKAKVAGGKPTSKKALTYAGTALRTDTSVSDQVKALASANRATIQAKADKLNAEKDAIDEAKAANNYQAKARNNGKSQDTAIPLVTIKDKSDALQIWKDLLISTNHYLPFIQRSAEEELKAVKVLRSAMSNYRSFHLTGMEKLRDTHNEYCHLQEKYYIPKDFCMPADFFREEQLNHEFAYEKRCCSVYDFYRLLSVDTPGFVDRQTLRANTYPPGSNEVIKSLRHQSPVNEDITKRRVNPAYDPFSSSSNQPQRQSVITSSSQPQRQNVITSRSANPSKLDWEQQKSAEKAEAVRRAPRKNAPIPETDDDTNTDGETSLLFESKLSGEDKSRILRLAFEIRQIKSSNLSAAYLKERVKAINNAELERLAGRLGPAYLAGVPHPWYPDHGQAPLHYNVDQVESRQSVIDRIKESNAVLCQLEYTATKGGPGGQGRR